MGFGVDIEISFHFRLIVNSSYFWESKRSM